MVAERTAERAAAPGTAKQESLAAVLLRTAGLRVAVLPITAACSLTTAGLTVHYAGALAFGFITMIAQLQIALPFADLGLGAAVARATARAGTSRQALEQLHALVRRTALVLAAVGITGACAATLAGTLGLWTMVFQVPDTLGPQVNLVVSVVLSVFFMSLPLGLSARVLVGRDRSDLLVLLGLIPPAGNLVGVLVLGHLEVTSAWLAVALPLSTLTFQAVCGYLAFVHPRIGIRGLRPPEGEHSGQAAPGQRPEDSTRLSTGTILLGGLPVLLSMAGLALAEQHGRLVLATTAEPGEVSEYAIALQLYMPLYSVLFMGATVLWPRFAVNPHPALWRRANLMLTGLGTSAALGFALLARPVARLISGGELVPSWAVVLGLSAALAAQSAHLTQANLFTDRRGFWRQAVMSCTLLSIVVPGTVLGVHLGLGAAAPGISMATGVVLAQVVPGLVMAHRFVTRLDRASSSPSDSSSPSAPFEPPSAEADPPPPTRPVHEKGPHSAPLVSQTADPRS